MNIVVACALFILPLVISGIILLIFVGICALADWYFKETYGYRHTRLICKIATWIPIWHLYFAYKGLRLYFKQNHNEFTFKQVNK